MFSDILRSARIARGISQEELAERVDITRTQVSRYETGKSLPDFRTIIKIADVLDVSLDYLAERDAPVSRKPLILQQPQEKAPFKKSQLTYLEEMQRRIDELEKRLNEEGHNEPAV